MKKLIFLILAMQVAQSLSAQRKAVFTFFDGDWNRTEDTNKAKYFKRLQKQDGKKWQLDYYNFAGPMIKTETVTDKNATTKDGRYASYHPSGYVDSAGEFVNNKPHGEWSYYNDKGKAIFRKTYQNGTVVNSNDLSGDGVQPVADSARDNLIVEKPSEFNGGRKEWAMYLNRNLRYPPEAMSARIMGDVVVMFWIDTDGKAKDINLYKSVQVLLDGEALRLITDSPAWNAAENNGKKVRSFKRQGITFRTE